MPTPPTAPSTSAPSDAALVEELARLRAERDLLAAALEAVPDLVLIKGPHSRIVYANRGFRDYYGMSLEQLRDQIDAPFVEPDQTLQYVRDDAHVFATGEPLEIPSEPITRHDGAIRQFATVKSAIRDAAGTITHTVGISRDITIHAELTAAQHEQEGQLRLFEALADDALDGISVADSSGVINYANAAFRAMTGYGDAVIGMPFTELYPPESQQRVIHEATPSVVQRGSWQGELEARRPNGERWVAQLSARLLTTSRGVPQLAAIFRDVTAQQQAAAEREQLQENIIRAQQEALRELSTPLIPIAEGVVVMPLIGSIDSLRAQQFMDNLLSGVSELRATTTIIDITGVPLVDTQVASALLRAAEAVKLLGANVVLTGIRPEVAQTLVGLGVNLGSIATRGTLQSGVAYALARRAR